MCTYRNIAFAENVDDAHVSASANAASPMRLVRTTKAAPTSDTRSLHRRLKLRPEKIFRKKPPNDDSSCVELKQSACTHSNDRVTEADVREEERQPAREGVSTTEGRRKEIRYWSWEDGRKTRARRGLSELIFCISLFDAFYS